MHVPGGIRTRNSSQQAAANPRLRPRGRYVLHSLLLRYILLPLLEHFPRPIRFTVSAVSIHNLFEGVPSSISNFLITGFTFHCYINMSSFCTSFYKVFGILMSHSSAVSNCLLHIVFTKHNHSTTLRRRAHSFYKQSSSPQDNYHILRKGIEVLKNHAGMFQ